MNNRIRNKAFLYLLCGFLLFGCKEKGDNYYLIVLINGIPEVSYAYKSETKEEAINKAVDYINSKFDGREKQYIERDIRMRLGVKEDPDWSWSLPDGTIGGLYSTPTPNIFIEQDAYRKEAGKKAYAGAVFGMQPNEVSSLPHFKNYLRRGNSMYHHNEQIGYQYYTVYLHFGPNTGLYRIDFLSKRFELDEAEKYLNDFMTIIKQTYGPPISNAVTFDYWDEIYTQARYLKTKKNSIMRMEENEGFTAISSDDFLKGGRWIFGYKIIDIFTEKDDFGRAIVHGRMYDEQLKNGYLDEDEVKQQKTNWAESSSRF